jgi:amidohydrolase
VSGAGGAAGGGVARGGAAGLKERVAAAVARESTGLVDLSHRIHSKPELGFEEESASEWCAEELSQAGLSVEMGICDLPTAFVASAGSGPFVVAICAEYDALPGIGHACGHNVIAAAAIGAARALAPIADDLGITLRVLGTPAEEGGGGKVLMMERGGFDGVNAAMMVHPAPGELDRMPCLAVEHFDVIYHGKEAHASAFPERGINAADALTVAQVAVGLLRQHADFGDQVHGIVTLGGAAPNIVPALTVAKYYVRARTLKTLETWSPRVRRCFEAGAIATGSTLEIIPQGPTYSEFHTDEAMARLYHSNAVALGRVFPPLGDRTMSGSTDMANVSLAIPSIHPMLGLDSFPAVNHQPEFTAAAGGPVADQAVLDGATAMAWTVIDLATSSDERERLTAAAYQHGG